MIISGAGVGVGGGGRNKSNALDKMRLSERINENQVSA